MSDEDIIQRYLQTDENAMVGELYNRYARLVFGLSLKYLKNKEESKDLLLGVFERLLVDLKKYEIKNFKSWLYTYTKNECLMFLRKKSLNVIESDVFEANVRAYDDEVELENSAEDKLVVLEKHVSTLAYEQQQCIRMFFMENKSYQQISDETGLTFKQIKSFIQNGKRNLRIKLSGLAVNE